MAFRRNVGDWMLLRAGEEKQMNHWHCLRIWRTSASFSAFLAHEVCIIIHLLSYCSLVLANYSFFLLFLLNRDNSWCLMKPLEGSTSSHPFHHLTKTSDSPGFLSSSVCSVRKRYKCRVALRLFLDHSHCSMQIWMSLENNHLRNIFLNHELLIGQ